LNTRALAADVLVQVVGEGKTLTLALDEALPGIPQDNDRAFVQALCYGVLRWYGRLEQILELLVRKPIKDAQVRMLALLGLYQLRYMRVKPHAAVGETVAAAGPKTWAKPLLNGVLRTYQRQQADLEARAEDSEASATAHPGWLVERFKQDWPAHYAQLLAHNNNAPPLALRVNRLKLSRDAFLSKLSERHLSGQPSKYCDDAVILDAPCPIDKLPGFAAGEVSVQDTAAQLAAVLLDAASGQRVLDLCAAPGGKTAHILELCPNLGELVAVDIAPERIKRVQENLTRSGLTATLITADAAQPDVWWDHQLFDRILLDAPCSATGVIRRHPDIKVLRKPTDIDELTTLQSRILEAAWTMLAPGGRLVYATCSVLRAENEAIIARFLDRHDDAREISVTAEWGMAVNHGRQILTGAEGMDGFYYAVLERPPGCA
jgi:16S rRNA (cytosine967-C5)-methyltransferase